MAMKSFNPYKVQFRTIKIPKSNSISKKHSNGQANNWGSIYKNDYNKFLIKTKKIQSNNISNIDNEINKEKIVKKQETNSIKNIPLKEKKVTIENQKNLKCCEKEDSVIKDEFYHSNGIANCFPNLNSKHEVKLNNWLHNNKEYFTHIGFYCICGKCICGKCKCNHPKRIEIPMKSGKESTYMSDFNNKAPLNGNHSKKINNFKFNKTFMDLKTIQRLDYNKKKNFNNDIKLKDNKQGGFNNGVEHLKAPFPGTTSYKDQFIGYKNTICVQSIKPIKDNQLNKKIPLLGTPVNKDYGNFNSEEFRKVSNLKHNNGKPIYKNPLGPYMPLNCQTTSKFYHKKFPFSKSELGKPGNFNYIKPEIYNSTYKTINMDYDGKIPINCPARNIINEVSTLRTKKIIDKIN